MVSENDYQERYKRAQTAYLEGDLTEAGNIAENLIQEYPSDASVLLLRAHIYLRQQQLDVAQATYQEVLTLTDHEDLVELAQQGLSQIEEEQKQQETRLAEDYYDSDAPENFYPPEVESSEFDSDLEEIDDDSDDSWSKSLEFENLEWEAEDLEDEELEDPTLQQNSLQDSSSSLAQDSQSFELEYEDEDDEDETAANVLPTTTTNDAAGELESNLVEDDSGNFLSFDPANLIELERQQELQEQYNHDGLEGIDENVGSTFMISNKEPELRDLEQILTSDENLLDDLDEDYEDYSSELEPLGNNLGNDEADDTGSNPEEINETPLIIDEEDFFFSSGELDDIPDIEADELPVSSIFSPQSDDSGDSTNNLFGSQNNLVEEDAESDITGSFTFDTQKINLDGDEEISASPLADVTSIGSNMQTNPVVEVNQGKWSKYFDLSLFNKQLLHGGVTALVTFIVVLLVNTFSGGEAPTSNPNETTTPETTEQVESEPSSNSFGRILFLALVAGVAGGGTTIALGMLLNRHVKNYIIDLQNQFESVYQGNYDVKATISSQDELGMLATGFNQMAKMIKTTTTEARKRAEETERAREDLQRQVIRLLDDVEGAARGDLTVQAEVTADVLGAVADAFNLTITNLRKIVKQVQQAAIQVNKASADSEVFARNQSSDALRMAEELAVTLNSVQMMTDSIQRVAENAREAEEVARSSSVTALKGGDAVERTVSGILQIRETVSETTRKVKRLAEASQQISTIVAVISQISSRTNLLALNASIQAARAGDAGRGFAIVADEVRQLADRSAKSLQEIEQIVLQIQTETGSVMTAMEEGIQQVRDVTERSEQAKRALEDIIQVSNRIDALVRSITADTDEQRENSRGVAKVMQAVELTAQATSQESQRVAGSLQNLVVIGKDLIDSVERFKVDE